MGDRSLDCISWTTSLGLHLMKRIEDCTHTEKFVSCQIVARYGQVIDLPLCQLKARFSD